jgi:hypothetical protein
MKTQAHAEKRTRRRFELALTVRFRLTCKGSASRWVTGTIHDMSSTGISFRCRGPLPVGNHLELHVAWPATRGEEHSTHLRATGLIVRSSGTLTALRITWHRLDIEPAVALSLSAIA